MRRLLLPLALLVAMAPGTAGAAPTEPTTYGVAVVGFQALPALGATLGGHRIEKVEPRGPWVTVAADDLVRLRRDLAGVAGIAYVEDDARMVAFATPNDTRYGEQYGPPMMKFPAAWDAAGYGSSAVTVAVIDTGLFRTHADFTPASRFLTGHDYVQNDSNPQDGCGHGTHVSGTVAATTNNATGVAGMSQASILPMRALGNPDLLGQCSGSHSAIAQAIMDSADQGAKIISMSIGGGSSSTLSSAVVYADARGVMMVAAAGNDGASNSVDYPAAYAQVIAVAALTSGKTRASYSDMGADVEIAAPGSGVLSTYSNGGYSSLSGTSMATPHVSGALALAWSCAPAGTTAAQLRTALQTTAEDLGTAGRDTSYGFGLARADLLVNAICTGGGGTNNPPVASFTKLATGLSVSVDGTGSSDPDNDLLSHSWTFGDGGTATGATATHAYAAAGTYTITLTVTDGRGGSNSTSQQVTVTDPGDPDPSTPNLTSGQTVFVSTAQGQSAYYKILVPAGASQLQVTTSGGLCTTLACLDDHDLYTRYDAKPTDTAYACRPALPSSNETCTHAAPVGGWWYVRVYTKLRSTSIQLRAVVS